MTDPKADSLEMPRSLVGEEFLVEEAEERLREWGHRRPRRWLRRRLTDGEIAATGTPPRLRSADLWRALLKDECDKLYNQAWCALDQIRAAKDPDEVLMLVVDDFPSAVEQAFSLAPPFATEHLDLLREYSEEKLAAFRRELSIGEEDEPLERMECLAFWEANAEGMSPLRRTLYRMVREELARRATPPPSGPSRSER
jgi:hypothetical protein